MISVQTSFCEGQPLRKDKISLGRGDRLFSTYLQVKHVELSSIEGTLQYDFTGYSLSSNTTGLFHMRLSLLKLKLFQFHI